MPELLCDKGHEGVQKPEDRVKDVHQNRTRRRRRRNVLAIGSGLACLRTSRAGF